MGMILEWMPFVGYCIAILIFTFIIANIILKIAFIMLVALIRLIYGFKNPALFSTHICTYCSSNGSEASHNLRGDIQKVCDIHQGFIITRYLKLFYKIIKYPVYSEYGNDKTNYPDYEAYFSYDIPHSIPSPFRLIDIIIKRLSTKCKQNRMKMLFPFVFLSMFAFILSIAYFFTDNDVIKYIWIGFGLSALVFLPYANSVSRKHNFSKKNIETADHKSYAENEKDNISNQGQECENNPNNDENNTEIEVSLLIPHVLSFAFNHLKSIIRRLSTKCKQNQIVIEHQPRDSVKLPTIQVGRPRRLRISHKTPGITEPMPKLSHKKKSRRGRIIWG